MVGDGKVRDSSTTCCVRWGINGLLSTPPASSQAFRPSVPNWAWTAPSGRDDNWPSVWIPKRCNLVLLAHERGSSPMERPFKKSDMLAESRGTLVARPPLVVAAAT